MKPLPSRVVGTVAVLALAAVACTTGRTDNSRLSSDALVGHMRSSFERTSDVAVADLPVVGSWDRLFVFAPHTPEHLIERRTGPGNWRGSEIFGRSGAEDGFCLLVFVNGGSTESWMDVEGRPVDFCAPTDALYMRDEGFARDAAVLHLSRGSDGRIEVSAPS